MALLARGVGGGGGVGNFFKWSCPGRRGGGENRNNYLFKDQYGVIQWRLTPRGQVYTFVGSIKFVSECLEKNNLFHAYELRNSLRLFR